VKTFLAISVLLPRFRFWGGAQALTAASDALFLFFATVTGYMFGSNRSPKFKTLCHPLLTATALSYLAMLVLAGCGVGYGSFMDVLRTYTVKSMTPSAFGAGDVLLFFLGPAVIALSSQMYERRNLMKQNLLQCAVGCIGSSFVSIFSTAWLAKAVKLSTIELRLATLSRNITSPLAMAMAKILGADVGIAVSLVVLTGLLGANVATTILTKFGVNDPVARGLAIGAASHGLGTAAISDDVEERDAFPFSAIAMTLVGVFSVSLVNAKAIHGLIQKVV